MDKSDEEHHFVLLETYAPELHRQAEGLREMMMPMERTPETQLLADTVRKAHTVTLISNNIATIRASDFVTGFLL